jgi:hypothetical protein
MLSTTGWLALARAMTDRRRHHAGRHSTIPRPEACRSAADTSRPASRAMSRNSSKVRSRPPTRTIINNSGDASSPGADLVKATTRPAGRAARSPSKLRALLLRCRRRVGTDPIPSWPRLRADHRALPGMHSANFIGGQRPYRRMKSSLDSSNTSGRGDSTPPKHVREPGNQDSNPDQSPEVGQSSNSISARLDVCRRFGQPRRMMSASSVRFMLKHGRPPIAELSQMNIWIPSLSTGASRHGDRVSWPSTPRLGLHRNLMPLSGGSQLDRAAMRMPARRRVRSGPCTWR